MKTGRPRKEDEIDWASLPLGKATIREVSEQAGCSMEAVRRAMKRLGIGHYKHNQYGACVIDWSKYPLGKVPEEDIARDIGCHVKTVKRACSNRDIQLYGMVKKKVQCSTPGCNNEAVNDRRIKNPDGLCRYCLMPDDLEELRAVHLSGWGSSMLGRAIGD